MRNAAAENDAAGPSRCPALPTLLLMCLRRRHGQYGYLVVTAPRKTSSAAAHKRIAL